MIALLRFKVARFNAKLTQYDVAAKTGIHQSRISLTQAERESIAEVLKCKGEDILYEKNKGRKRKEK